ncbi:basic proline-rich protein-like [Pseudopipra pipra]|uniref:basic proline-rich protein-like n=1 Tax=Pseudopipra pipra TaxID=415032 RepID=UPI003138C776
MPLRGSPAPARPETPVPLTPATLGTQPTTPAFPGPPVPLTPAQRGPHAQLPPPPARDPKPLDPPCPRPIPRLWLSPPGAPSPARLPTCLPLPTAPRPPAAPRSPAPLTAHRDERLPPAAADKAAGRRAAASRRTKGPGAAPPRPAPPRPPVRTDRPAPHPRPAPHRPARSVASAPLRAGRATRRGALAPFRPVPHPPGGAALGPPRPRLGRPRRTVGRGRRRPKLARRRLPPHQFHPAAGCPAPALGPAPPRSHWLPGGRSREAKRSGGFLPTAGEHSEPRVRLSPRGVPG